MKPLVILLSTTISLLMIARSELTSAPVENFMMEFPLTKSLFKYWSTDNAALFLKNRLVLTPQSFDKAGMLFNKEPFLVKNFEMVIDFQISNSKVTPLAHGAMQIYFLRDNPQRSAHEFARAFNFAYNGFMIEIKENVSRQQSTTSQPQRTHDIYGVLTDSDGNPINNAKLTMCRKAFTDAKMKIVYNNGIVTVYLKNKVNIDEDYEQCFSFEADLNYEKFFFVSAISGKALNNHHYITSIQTYDLDKKVEQSGYQAKHQQELKTEQFVKAGTDLLYQKQDVSKNRSLTMESYNRQLIRQTTLYSKVMSQFIRNQEKQIEILSDVPKDYTLLDLQKFAIRLSSQADISATLIQKLNTDSYSKVQYVEQLAKNSGKDNQKMDRFSIEEKKLEQTAATMQDTIQGYSTILGTDKLLLMVKETSKIRDNNIQALIEANELKSEEELTKHIREKMQGRQSRLEQQLQDDDLVDWFLFMALVAVAIFGIVMWKRLKDQQSILL